MGMINTSVSGNVTVTFTKDEWFALQKLSQIKTAAEKSGNIAHFIAEDAYGYSTGAAYAGGLEDGRVLLARQIVGDAA